MRITQKMLESQIAELNRTLGRPSTSASVRKGGGFEFNVGYIDIDKDITGYKLEQFTNTGGGETSLTPRMTAREIYVYMEAMMFGVQMLKERS